MFSTNSNPSQCNLKHEVPWPEAIVSEEASEIAYNVVIVFQTSSCTSNCSCSSETFMSHLPATSPSTPSHPNFQCDRQLSSSSFQLATHDLNLAGNNCNSLSYISYGNLHLWSTPAADILVMNNLLLDTLSTFLARWYSSNSWEAISWLTSSLLVLQNSPVHSPCENQNSHHNCAELA